MQLPSREHQKVSDTGWIRTNAGYTQSISSLVLKLGLGLIACETPYARQLMNLPQIQEDIGRDLVWYHLGDTRKLP